MADERNVQAFNEDAAAHDGYVYTTSDRLSCQLSNARMTRAILELGDVAGKRVIDIGCGDGTYTASLAEAGAASVLGVDAADVAIERARDRCEAMENVTFDVVDIYALEAPAERYDLAVVRGILHHLYDVERAIERIAAVAGEIVVLEPNGYNPVLKAIEKLSPYHVEHEEKSYAPRNLDRWFENCGGRIDASKYVGLVPMFCPDTLARLCKAAEPIVEGTPGLRAVTCGQYVQRIRVG
ncbi:MAG: class I SAM-dependent methyltransferase [Myxococcota bacterium]|nr:class I SAM-dependent methyltransferase [Myxococcota bacterium]